MKKLFAVSALIICFCTFLQAQITFTPTDDSYIYAGGLKANDPYGIINPDTLKTRKSVASEEFTRETYVRFSTGAFDTTFSSVVVKLYGTVAEMKRTQIYYTDTLWSEETLTGNNRPAGAYISDLLLQPGTDYYAWDVTNYMNQAVAEGRKAVAFIFKDVAGAVSTKDTPWHSKENPSGKPPLIELTAGPAPYHRAGAYYIDNVAGNDTNSADGPFSAWKTLDRLNAEYFAPGDSIFFKCDGYWEGQLLLKGSGKRGMPIVIGSYDSGNKPLISGSGLVTNTVQFTGQHHIEMQDLHITNFGSSPGFRRGIHFLAEDMGPVEHVIFRRLEVSNVNGIVDATEKSKNNGGIIFEIGGSAKETWFDTLVVEDCYIHDVDRTGMANLSTWDTRTLTSNTNWVPSRNILIRGNIFEKTGCNALIVRVADKPLMEHNLFNQCAIKASGNACFNFNTDGALWQYNEACFTKYNAGDEDAGGFDSDFKSRKTVIQYNYSHDNDWGAVLVTGGTTGNFNDSTIVRYNLFVNNKHHEIKTSGHATNTLFHNNTVYNRPSMTGIIAVWHKSWEGYSINTSYLNNIFQIMGSGATMNLGGSMGNVFDFNVFYGANMSYEPDDDHKIKSNPMLCWPDSAGYGSDTIGGYRLKQGSPAINSGTAIPGSPVVDIEGSPVPMHGVTDRGAYEYAGPLGTGKTTIRPVLRLHPNPAREEAVIEIRDNPAGKGTLQVIALSGKKVFEGDFDFHGGEQRITLPVERLGLEPGCYLVRISVGSGFTVQSLLLVEK